MSEPDAGRRALRVRVAGTVQGVGFRPFVYRIALDHGMAGWVRNVGAGVEIHLQGSAAAVASFLRDLERSPPPAAQIAEIERDETEALVLDGFAILESVGADQPTARISPDLPTCGACLAELRDAQDRRFGYPYINCTDCGPRYSIVLGLPYDRAQTTMRAWPMCERCAREYGDPTDRRFHAQPNACPVCGPGFLLRRGDGAQPRGSAAIEGAVELLVAGAIVAIKGIGGYHLACDATRSSAVAALRTRKVRREKPFALMVPSLEVARRVVELDPEAEALLTSSARPIVLAPARSSLDGVSPENLDLGVMLPYAPLHTLLFAAGAPELLVLTSANRSSEPIAYTDGDAMERLAGVADAFLIGERPIARRVEDSVATAGALGPVVLRRARGYSPGVVARLPGGRPVLAVGPDLKNSITLVVDGSAFVSQHIGDLDEYAAMCAHRETIADLLAMYRVPRERLQIAYDLHPEYRSTQNALSLDGSEWIPVQHHRAHVASVLAERGELDRKVLGICCDGTGFGDDGTIWGGELFLGSVAAGFERVAHLRPASLPGGDAAARFPVQAAAGFLAQVEEVGDLTASPFGFPPRYAAAGRLLERDVRTFRTTSVGRLFDTAAALLGFSRAISFEGQAAIWLEHRARGAAGTADPLPFPFDGHELDFRPALSVLMQRRRQGRDDNALAADFHRGLASGLAAAALELASVHGLDTVVVSGGVFQNQLLTGLLRRHLREAALTVWSNSAVPPNDGGVSLGQAALVAAAGRAAAGPTSSARSTSP